MQTEKCHFSLINAGSFAVAGDLLGRRLFLAWWPDSRLVILSVAELLVICSSLVCVGAAGHVGRKKSGFLSDLFPSELPPPASVSHHCLLSVLWAPGSCSAVTGSGVFCLRSPHACLLLSVVHALGTCASSRWAVSPAIPPGVSMSM